MLLEAEARKHFGMEAEFLSDREMLLKPQSRIQVMEGAKHNLPDRESLKAASAIRELAEGLTAEDLLLVLISGGGSALLPAPAPPVTLEEKETVTKLLASKGATIQELNTIRKSLSVLKGGGLARAAFPAQVVSLILSDIIGDPVDLIASGPTVISPPNIQDCFQILAKYDLINVMPESVHTVLSHLATEHVPPTDSVHVHNVIIGSNRLALEEAKRQAENLGYLTLVLSDAVCGEVSTVACLYSLFIQLVCLRATGNDLLKGKVGEALSNLAKELEIPGLNLVDTLNILQGSQAEIPVCLLAGGETTVQLAGSGKGGRNQELALRVALELHRAKSSGHGSSLDKYQALFLSGATDGQDGPTEAAGAFSSQELVGEAEQAGFNVEAFLINNDSYTFFSSFQSGSHLLLTGLTGTNVMDIHTVLIRAKGG
ncbi:glycerate kinase isoform X2 [Sphaerodactylus townsendi]|uniref:glycerate kinase isoform X2 n=2 Tax=Sphaerodactylus townsendi TaxID=933632 RepID=UPI0020262235|nr:glycerate kinase isoform X2 [Sphaerodactylus townsendi]XP_048347270.1 glycerate kinase isoform X2 [Sphaerodactylus townsendi]